MHTDLLRTFAVVAETRHFTRAAERLNCVQSAVSMQIKRLEEALQVRLLERTRRHVTLTPQGEIFLRYAHRVLHLTDETLIELGYGDKAGRVRLAATDMSIGFLPPVFEHFRLRHPLVEVEFGCMQSREALEALEEDRADLAFVTQTCGREGGRLVAETPLIWAAARAADCVYRKAALEALEGQGVSYRLAYQSPNRAGLNCVAEAGLAVTVLPATAMGDKLRDVSDKLPALPNLKTYVFTAASNATPAVDALEGALIETLG